MKGSGYSSYVCFYIQVGEGCEMLVLQEENE